MSPRAHDRIDCPKRRGGKTQSKTPIALLAAFAAAAVLAPTTAAAVVGYESVVIAAADSEASDGEIRKVDPATRKITIRHGELKTLDMPAMTMVFQVSDPAMLEKVKAGDKVKFRAEKVNGVFTVTQIEVVK